MSDDKRITILKGAEEAFSRYGFAKTSMADVADLAGVSRPALYEHFKNKSDLFHSLSHWLCEVALASAVAAWPERKSFSDGLADAVIARELYFFRLCHGAPHGAELMAHGAELTEDIHEEMEAAFVALVVKRLKRRGQAANTLALTIVRAMEGVKNGATSEPELISSVQQLAALFGAALS